MNVLRIRLDREDAIFASDEFPALYESATSSIHFHRQPDLMLLLHEISHHFTDHVLPHAPLWLNEGLATYLGWSAMDGERILTGDIPVVHYKALKELARENRFVPFQRFLDLDHEAFYSSENHLKHYTQAWGIVFFFFQHRMGETLSFADKLDALAGMDREALLDLESDFRHFAETFDATAFFEERLDSKNYGRRLSAAFRMGLLQDEGGIDSLLAHALDRHRDLRFREICLYSAAMTALGTSRRVIKDRVMVALLRLADDSSPRLREIVRDLNRAFKEMDREAIARRFQELGALGGFYPAGRFSIRNRRASGPEDRSSDG